MDGIQTHYLLVVCPATLAAKLQCSLTPNQYPHHMTLCKIRKWCWVTVHSPQQYQMSIHLWRKKFERSVPSLFLFFGLLSFFNWPQRLLNFSCLTQQSMKVILLINVKMSTIIGILLFISRINTPSECIKQGFFFSSVFSVSISS